MNSRAHSQDNVSDLVLFFAIAVTIFVAVGIWKFGQYAGVDFNTAGITLFRLVGLTVGFCGLLFLSKKYFDRVKEVLLFYPPLYVYAVAPILNYKATHLVPEFMIGSDSVQLPLWGTSLGQFGIFIILELVAFLIWYFTRDE
jgi:hypothetical protein